MVWMRWPLWLNGKCMSGRGKVKGAATYNLYQLDFAASSSKPRNFTHSESRHVRKQLTAELLLPYKGLCLFSLHINGIFCYSSYKRKHVFKWICWFCPMDHVRRSKNVLWRVIFFILFFLSALTHTKLPAHYDVDLKLMLSIDLQTSTTVETLVRTSTYYQFALKSDK